MIYDVQITDKAKRDLNEIVKYIKGILVNPDAASSLLDDFFRQKSFLAKNPYMFPRRSILKLHKKGYHRFIFKNNYIALYLIDEKKKIVTIMYILYAKRDYGKLL